MRSCWVSINEKIGPYKLFFFGQHPPDSALVLFRTRVRRAAPTFFEAPLDFLGPFNTYCSRQVQLRGRISVVKMASTLAMGLGVATAAFLVSGINPIPKISGLTG